MSQPYRQPSPGSGIYPTVQSSEMRSSQPIILRLHPKSRRGAEPILSLIMMVIALLVVMLLMGLGGGVVAYGYYQIGNRIFPGIKVGDLSLSGMTVEDAAVVLDAKWNLDKSLLVTNGIQNIQIHPLQIGIKLDSRATAQRALEIGRQGSIISQLLQVVTSPKNGWQVEPIVTVDSQAALLGLQALVPMLSHSPKDASIQLQGADLVAIAPELGYTINIEESLKILESDPDKALNFGFLAVVPKPVMPAITDVTPVLEKARQLLNQPASVQVIDPISNEQTSFPISREMLASWVRVSDGDLGPGITLDERGVAAYLGDLSGQLGEGRSIDSHRFASPLAQAILHGKPFWVTAGHPPTNYTVQAGDTLLKVGWRMGMPAWMILEANPGLNPDKLIAGTSIVIPSKDDLLPLPIIPNKRIIISLSKQRLSVFQDGQQIRQHVISTGIDRSPTQPGIFQVQTHDPNAYASVWGLYMPDFLGIYEAWPGFMNGIHGLPLLSNGQRMWANSLGRPASYGCIILGLQEARWLYGWAEDGVIVEIRE